VISEVCKPLFLQVFHVFEPARSNSLKQFSLKGLANSNKKRGTRLENTPISPLPQVISTAGGIL
jgi:hypothetical protein